LTDLHGHFQITGRVDDVINVRLEFILHYKNQSFIEKKTITFKSGHRIGTAEIEDAIVKQSI
jgi:acyl-coenzyme A synthetase/AMP-(fatty) acid ligase